MACYIRQAVQAARMSTDDEQLHWNAVRAVAEYLKDVPAGTDSIMAAENVHRRIRDAVGDPDPYLKVKEEFTAMAEKMEPQIDEMARRGSDPLLAAVKTAIAGNIIDFGAAADFDLAASVRDAMNFDVAVNHYDALKESLEKAATVLYLADNTGEIYFDKPLLRLLRDKAVTFVVRGAPSLNDATMEYAERAGIGRLAKLADTGIQSMGFPLERIAPEIRDLFFSADVVVSKGQANFESLFDAVRTSLFFLMKVKCDLVARMLGAHFGDICIMESGRISLNEEPVAKF